MERRQHPRQSCFKQIRFTVARKDYSGVMLNISPGGAFIMTHLPLHRGQPIELQYCPDSKPEQQHRLTGTIVRRENTGIGVRLAP